ncbi:MAG: hypothetical protein NVS4B3_05980 [Gemmatimonadaceae bacterium]
MRTLPALALVLAAACGRNDRHAAPLAHGATTTSNARAASGPDPILIRIPRSGGIARAFIYPRLDSAVWASTAVVPSVDRVLGFDAEAGSLAYVDMKGLPRRFDLRLGTAVVAATSKLMSLSSADGSALYGIVTGDGAVSRLTPSGRWTYRPPGKARDVFPLADGSLIVAGDRGAQTVLWKLHPPDDRIVDTALVARPRRVAASASGDRLYIATDSGLAGVRTRDLSRVPSVRFPHVVRTFVTTPSGDRVYVAVDSSTSIAVIDRYRDAVDHTITLPGVASDLRIDPLGRYLLARPAKGDSAWLIAVGTDRVVGSFATTWRFDLPAVVSDGRVVVVKGPDIVLLDPVGMREARRFPGASADSWLFVRWDGFRPRAAGLDEPVTFGNGDTTIHFASDSAGGRPAAALDSAHGSPSPSSMPSTADSTARRAPLPPAPPSPAAAPPRPATPGFTVSFAAMLTEEAAQVAAGQIRVGSETPRVVVSQVGGQTVYRVVLGPYPTRADAERVAHGANHTYWIYEGKP